MNDSCCPGQPPSKKARQSTSWHRRFATLAAQCRDPRLQAFYRRTPVAAATPLDTTPLLALDIETTGLDDRRDAIVSIGWIPFDLHRIRCRGAVHRIVRPDLTFDDCCATIHGITHSDLMAAPAFGDVFESLLQAMAGRVVVAHCHEIERRFLAAACTALTGDTFQFPMIDTMRIEAQAAGRQAQGGILRRWFGGRRRQCSLRLDAARSRYGLPPYRPHHALTDALATAELFQAQVQHHLRHRTPTGQLWR